MIPRSPNLRAVERLLCLLRPEQLLLGLLPGRSRPLDDPLHVVVAVQQWLNDTGRDGQGKITGAARHVT